VLQRIALIGQNRYVGAAVVGSIAGLLLLLFFLLIRGQRETVVLELHPLADTANIHVYVGGNVTSPGLYMLPRGSRVSHALEAAGGVLTNSDMSGIGMAAPLRDSDQIIIPARQPTPVAQAPATANTSVSGWQSNGIATPPPAEIPSQPSIPGSEVEPDAPININNATAHDLGRLPGIGPAIAERIIEYRIYNGPFQTVEELAGVSGISERMVDEFRHLISLGY
jgi:competence protein ComEA